MKYMKFPNPNDVLAILNLPSIDIKSVGIHEIPASTLQFIPNTYLVVKIYNSSSNIRQKLSTLIRKYLITK